MYVPVEKCATSDIRQCLLDNHLIATKPRSECIRILKENNIYVIDVNVVPKKLKKEKKVFQPQEPLAQYKTLFQPQEPLVQDKKLFQPQEPLAQDKNLFQPQEPQDKNLFQHVNVFDVPQNSTQQISQTRQQVTDAVFSHAAVRNLTVDSSLNVRGHDILHEIQRIKHLRTLLVQDFEHIRVSFDNMRVAFQKTVNQDLPMYNIAHDIAHNGFEQSIDFLFDGDVEISSPSFYGKIEDSTVNLDMNFVVEFETSTNVRPERFTVDLPHPMDTGVLSIVPVMVTVYFDYDEQTGEYLQVSSISHGYIDKDTPNRVVIYSNVMKDIGFTKFQFDIAARYLCLVDSNTISPVRFGSLHKQTLTSENGNVSHQWSDVDHRIDLFTNLDVSQISTDLDTIRIPLPVPMTNTVIQNIVGFGTLHYTTNIAALQQFVYTTNTPLVYVTQAEPSVLFVKSNLFRGFQQLSSTNNIQTMKLATHVSYQRAVIDDFVYDVAIINNRITWKTKSPINPYYFRTIRVNDVDALGSLMGSQTTWSVSTLGEDPVDTFRVELENEYIIELNI